jgi:hypothetical protein
MPRGRVVGHLESIFSMSRMPIICWCGICWMEGRRSLASKTRCKLPLCERCVRLCELLHIDDKNMKRLYDEWTALPEFEAVRADRHFSAILTRVMRKRKTR